MTTLTKGVPDALQGTARGAMLRDVTVAALLGLGLVWLAGFAGADVLHATAHDARHSVGFPCH